VVIVGELRPNIRVAVLSEGSSVVGFFPFERHRSAGQHPFGMLDSRDASEFRALLARKSTQCRRTGQVEETPVAAHFGLRGGEILAHWFPAYDMSYSKYSRGLIMHMRMAKFTPGVGVRVIDMGTGSTPGRNRAAPA
jgi:CelD/BcsL family acetyltransferase involved in cellulose biosynthesis